MGTVSVRFPKHSDQHPSSARMSCPVVEVAAQGFLMGFHKSRTGIHSTEHTEVVVGIDSAGLLLVEVALQSLLSVRQLEPKPEKAETVGQTFEEPVEQQSRVRQWPVAGNLAHERSLVRQC